MTIDNLPEILDALRAGLTRILGAQLEGLYLYGSRARGESRSDSDIDVLVVLHGDFDYFSLLERTAPVVAELSLRHDVVISRTFATSEQFHHSRTPLLVNIRREGVAL